MAALSNDGEEMLKLVIGHEEDTGKPAEGLAERVGHNDLTRGGYFQKVARLPACFIVGEL